MKTYTRVTTILFSCFLTIAVYAGPPPIEETHTEVVNVPEIHSAIAPILLLAMFAVIYYVSKKRKAS